MSAVLPLRRPHTLSEIGAHPQRGDVLRIREGDYAVDLRVESADKGIVRASRTVIGESIDAQLFEVLCAEPGAEVGE